jgi:hypothetical protein
MQLTAQDAAGWIGEHGGSSSMIIHNFDVVGVTVHESKNKFAMAR